MSEPESPYEKKLEAALQHAGEWKARAFKAQKAATNLKQTAEAIKERALTAVESNRELNDSLNQAQQEKVTALNQLSALEQQLNLFQMALTELRGGQETQDILAAIRSERGDPEVEKRLAENLQLCQEELSASEAYRESAKDEMWANRSALESKIRVLENQNRELSDAAESIHSIEAATAEAMQVMEEGAAAAAAVATAERAAAQQAMEEAAAAAAVREGELESQLSETQLELKAQAKALKHVESQLALVENDSQILVEELYVELEAARKELGFLSNEKAEREQDLSEQVSLLEDAMSDLEIVNAELYQRISELET